MLAASFTHMRIVWFREPKGMRKAGAAHDSIPSTTSTPERQRRHPPQYAPPVILEKLFANCKHTQTLLDYTGITFSSRLLPG